MDEENSRSLALFYCWCFFGLCGSCLGILLSCCPAVFFQRRSTSMLTDSRWFVPATGLASSRKNKTQFVSYNSCSLGVSFKTKCCCKVFYMCFEVFLAVVVMCFLKTFVKVFWVRCVLSFFKGVVWCCKQRNGKQVKPLRLCYQAHTLLCCGKGQLIKQ